MNESFWLKTGYSRGSQDGPPLKRLKGMCIYINMSIMEKVFHYEATELSVIKFKDEIWFKAKQVALLLGYLDPGRSIRQNVDPEDRISLEKLIGKGGRRITPPPL